MKECLIKIRQNHPFFLFRLAEIEMQKIAEQRRREKMEDKLARYLK